MSRFSYLIRGAIGLGLIGVAACADADRLVVAPGDPIGGGLFKNYVAIGNSITAGWQSYGINDSTQRQSYANLIAIQAGTRFAYPSFPRVNTVTPPITVAGGCPAVAGNWFSQKLIDSLNPAAPPCSLRDPARVTDFLNNVAVPYAYTLDVDNTAAAVIAVNPLTTFILGGKSQIQAAIDADPTFVSVWLGNNETLFPATVGMVGGLPGTAPPLIPASVFMPAMSAALNHLVSGAKHLQGGILIGATKVTNTPRFFPADSIGIVAGGGPTRRTQINSMTGKSVTIVGCGTTVTGWLVSAEILPNIKKGTHPAFISCIKDVPAVGIGDIFMLDPTEVAAINATTDQYNVFIKAKADSLHWAYIDPNVLLLSLRQATPSQIPTVPIFDSKTRDASTAPFGTLFSLDGVHPSAAGQRVIANAIIDSVNSKYGTKLIKVP